MLKQQQNCPRRFTKPRHATQPKSAIFAFAWQQFSAASTFAVAMRMIGDPDFLFVRLGKYTQPSLKYFQHI